MTQEFPKKEKATYFIGNEAELLSDTSVIGPVSEEIKERIESAGWSEKETNGMLIPLVEVLANAMKHGNKEDKNKKVRVSLDITSERAIIVVRDEGEGFDWQNVPDPTLPENIMENHGRGVFLMREIFDEVKFNESGNEVTLIKYRKKEN